MRGKFIDNLITVESPWRDSRAYSDLSSLITLIGSAKESILITRGEVVTDLTIPSNISLYFDANGSISNSGTLNIQTTNIIAGNHQIFTGAGDINFADGSTLHLSWFADLPTAISKIGTANVTLIADAPSTLSADLTIPSNINFKPQKGSIITIEAKDTIYNESLATGDGTTPAFSGTLADPPLKRGSVTIHYVIGGVAYTATDDGTGKITGTSCAGIVDYISGAWRLSFATAPDNLIDITGDYTPVYQLTINTISTTNRYQIFSGNGVVQLPRVGTAFPEWWGENTTPGTTDMTSALWSAIFSGASEINFSDETYLVDSVFYGKPSDGIRFSGTAWRIGNSTSTIKYTGSGICFDFITEPLSVAVGGWEFKNLSFYATSASATMFEFNDINIDPVDSPPAAQYIMRVRFESCEFWGPGASATGNAIQAVKAFELKTDDSCLFTGWKRAIYLKGCDNCSIGGRFVLNGRHIHAERSGTFGNGLEIRARFLGTCSGNVAEPNYQLYLGTECMVYSPWFEGYTDGFMCFDNPGCNITVIKPYFGGGPAPNNVNFKLTSNCGPVKLIDPAYYGGITQSIDIETPSTYDWSGNNLPKTITFVRPSIRFLTYVLGDAGQKNPRVRIIDPEGSHAADMTKGEGVIINSNGLKRKGTFSITPFNIGDITYTADQFDSVIDDAGGYWDRAIALKTDVAESSILRKLIVGRDIENGDTIEVTVRYRLEAAPTVGTFRYSISRNTTAISNGAIGSSTTYTTARAVTYTLSGFANGDTLNVGVYAANLDVRALVAGVVIDIYDQVGVSTGAGSILMNSINAASNVGWLELKPGKWIPYWSTPTP